MLTVSTILNDQSGASAAEYALILALIAGVILASIQALGTACGNAILYFTNAWSNAGV